jgi:dephospho-CoA kinase
MLVIGLTGGIGSGKSSVCRQFADLGVPVIDTDQIAREVVAPGQPGLAQVRETFGNEVLTAEGELDRALLRKRVFADPEARQRLESILHPLIRTRMEEQLAALEAPYAIVAIPLLVEGGRQAQLDRVLVVDCSEELQIERVCQRDGASREQAQAILAAQCPRASRLEAADDVIYNDDNIAALKPQVAKLHQHYLQLAAQKEQS